MTDFTGWYVGDLPQLTYEQPRLTTRQLQRFQELRATYALSVDDPGEAPFEYGHNHDEGSPARLPELIIPPHLVKTPSPNHGGNNWSNFVPPSPETMHAALENVSGILPSQDQTAIVPPTDEVINALLRELAPRDYQQRHETFDIPGLLEELPEEYQRTAEPFPSPPRDTAQGSRFKCLACGDEMPLKKVYLHFYPGQNAAGRKNCNRNVKYFAGEDSSRNIKMCCPIPGCPMGVEGDNRYGFSSGNLYKHLHDAPKKKEKISFASKHGIADMQKFHEAAAPRAPRRTNVNNLPVPPPSQWQLDDLTHIFETLEPPQSLPVLHDKT